MAISVNSGFAIGVQEPIDTRMVVADLTARDAILSGVRYEGMETYVVSEEKAFRLIGGVDNTDWIEVGSGGGSGIGDPDILIAETFETTNLDDAGYDHDNVSIVATPIGGSKSLEFDSNGDDAHILSAPIPVPQKFRGRVVDISFWFKSTVAQGDFTFELNDETNSTVLFSEKPLPDPIGVVGSAINGFESISDVPRSIFKYLEVGMLCDSSDFPAGSVIDELHPDSGIINMDQDSTISGSVSASFRGKLHKTTMQVKVPPTCENISWLFVASQTSGGISFLDDFVIKLAEPTKDTKNILDQDFKGQFAQAENLELGFIPFADAAASLPVDMEGGSPDVTLNISRANSQLSFDKTITLTKDASNRQGNGVSRRFFVQPKDQGKFLTLKFDYEAIGSYVADDVKVFIYNKDKAKLHQPSNNVLVGSKGSISARFFSDPKDNVGVSHEYRVGVYIASTFASALTLNMSNFFLSDNPVIMGTLETPWTNFPTVTVQGMTVANHSMQYKVQGDTLKVRGALAWSAASANEMRLYLPAGFLTAPSVGNGDNRHVGFYNTGFSTTNDHGGPVIAEHGVNYLAFGHPGTMGSSAISPLTKINASTINGTGSGSISMPELSIPLSNAQGNVAMTQASTFMLSSVLASGTRVTTTPTKLGEWRSYQKASSSVNVGSDTAPNTLPSAANGMAIGVFPYATAGSGTYNISRYEAFIGFGKSYKMFAYDSAGRSGSFDFDRVAFGSSMQIGIRNFYDHATGVLTVDCTIYDTNINTVGLGLKGGSGISGYRPTTGFWDALISETATPIQVMSPNSEVIFNTGINSNGSTNTTVSRFANVSTEGTGLTAVQSTSLGDSVTVNEDGVYSLTHSAVASTTASNYIAITIDGSALTTDPSAITFAQGGRAWAYQSSDVFIHTSVTLRLKKGQVIRFQRSNTHLTTSSQNVAIVTQVSK